MKLTLKNFRCHEKETFDLPTDSFVLLAGASGKGKTTIFEAILYSLYGTVKKPITHGKSTCSVTLETDNISITRTTKPNNLIVRFMGQNYEKEEAQGVIDTFMGMNATEFAASSYVVQRSDSSVISFTPTEQLKFVQDIVFSDNFHTEVQSTIKFNIAETTSLKNTIETQIKMLAERIKIEEVNIKDIKEPTDQTSTELTAKLSELNSELADKRRELSIIEQGLKGVEQYKSQLQERQKRITELTSSIETLKKVTPVQGNIDELKEQLLSMKNEYSEFVKHENYQKAQKEFAKAKSDYFGSIKNQIQSVKKNKCSEKEVKEYEHLKEKYTIYLTEKALNDKFSTDKTKAEERYNEIVAIVAKVLKIRKTTKAKTFMPKLEAKIKEQKDILFSLNKSVKCPCCEEELVYQEEYETDGIVTRPALHKYISKEYTEKEISSAKTLYESLQTYYSELSEMINNVKKNKTEVSEFDTEAYEKLSDKVIAYKANSELIEEWENIVKNNILTSELLEMEEALAKSKPSKSKFKKSDFYKKNINDISDKISEYDKASEFISEKNHKEDELRVLKDKASTDSKTVAKTTSLKQEVKALEIDIGSITSLVVDTQLLLAKRIEYERYIDSIGKVKSLKSKLTKDKSSLKETEKKLVNLGMLLTISKRLKFFHLKRL